MMVDEEILQKVTNKTMFHMVDNGIYLVEVACITNILEGILSEIVCRGDNDNVLDEVEVVREIHMLEDGQGQVVDEHQVCQQGLHRGGDDLSCSQWEGDRQHQLGDAQEVRN